MDAGGFRALHQPGRPFILANAWDVGSAKVLAALGAEAIGTTSAGHAFTLGRPDGGLVSRQEALQHARGLVEAVSVPVSADLENGFGAAPEQVAETVIDATAVGLAGCSIEDTDLPQTIPYERSLAVARIEAAAEAARSRSRDFVLVARADGVMNGRYDMDEALDRVQAFAAAGADCVYVPLPPTLDDVRRVCKAVDVPVNALVAGHFTRYNRDQLADAGVARISLGSALARVTHKALITSALPVLADGDFASLTDSIAGDDVDRLLT